MKHLQQQQIQQQQQHDEQGDPSALFCHRNHSLKLSASKIAALAGLHPFAVLPELLLELVYQGRDGQALLQNDAVLLDLTITSADDKEEQVLLELANKVGTTKALSTLHEALNVKNGKRRVDTVSAAHAIAQAAVEPVRVAQNKLTRDEMTTFCQGVTQSVNTGFGRMHEEEALDLYQLKCGWPVRERNDTLMAWAFSKQDNDSYDNDKSSTNCTATTTTCIHNTPTVVPITPAALPVQRHHEHSASTSCSSTGTATAHDNPNGRDNNKDKRLPPVKEETNGNDIMDTTTGGGDGIASSRSTNDGLPNNKDKAIANGQQPGAVVEEEDAGRPTLAVIAIDNDNTTTAKNTDCDSSAQQQQQQQQDEHHDHCSSSSISSSVSLHYDPIKQVANNITNKSPSSLPSPQPFFTIYGSVDGIRDELWCARPNENDGSTENDNDDEEWTLRPIVVECKHRMRATTGTTSLRSSSTFSAPPPLYDQVQIAVYCLMYNVSEADLVQVIRRNNAASTSSTTAARPRECKLRKTETSICVSNAKALDKTTHASTSNTEDNASVARRPSSDCKDSDDNKGNSSPIAFNQVVQSTMPQWLAKEPADNPDGSANQESNCVTSGTTVAEGRPIQDTESSAVDCKTAQESCVGNNKDSTNAEIQVETPTTDKGRFLLGAALRPTTTTANGPGAPSANGTASGGGHHPQHHTLDASRTSDDETTNKSSLSSTEIEIDIKRISLDDPVMQHRRNWNDIVLPRLRSFVEAVYRIRADDCKRYRLLTSMSLDTSLGVTSNMFDAWNILHEECPWLKDCDTAFNRNF